MAATQYSATAVCVCGGPLKVFASSGRTQKACSVGCYPTPTRKDAACVDCGKPVAHAARRCKSCASLFQRKTVKAERKPKGQTGSCAGCGVSVWRGTKRCGTCYAEIHHTVKRSECKGCGKAFKPKKKKESKYCSRACAFADIKAWWVPARTKRQRTKFPYCSVWFKQCAGCGTSFVARSSRQRRRSAECVERISWHTVKHTADVAARALRPCKECGEMFKPEHGARQTCSERCSIRFHRRVRRHADRARKRAVAYEPVNALHVFERDGWRCQMCGKDTPKARRGTRHSNAPELDHRVPLSRGGAHTYGNTQCSCRECNQRKGNSLMVGQLPLFNHKVDGVGRDPVAL